jgi:hypothetical protein
MIVVDLAFVQRNTPVFLRVWSVLLHVATLHGDAMLIENATSSVGANRA